MWTGFGIFVIRYNPMLCVSYHFWWFEIPKCCNPNIGFVIKCEVRGPMRPRICLGVKQTFTNEGECKGWSSMIPKCTPTLGVAFVWKLRMFRALVGKANKHQIGPQDTIRKVLKHKCLKCLHIVYLDLICMSYDKKKQGGIKLRIWLPATKPLKARVK